MIQLGNIFVNTPFVVTIAGLMYDAEKHHTMIKPDVVELVRVARALKGANESTIQAACLPKDQENAPFVDACDIQLRKRKGNKTERIRIGYLYSDSHDQKGRIYQVRFDVEAVMKEFEIGFLHCHTPSSEEMNATMKEKDDARTPF